MTPAEAAAFRLGLEAGARVAERGRLVPDCYDHGRSTVVVDMAADEIAAAIRALPVPETAKSAECSVCRGSGLRFHCEDFDDCPECGGEGAINGPSLPAPSGGGPTATAAMAREFRLYAHNYGTDLELSDRQLRICLDAALRAARGQP